MTQQPSAMCPRNEQAVGWALHSLEPDEEMDVSLHLPQCPSCRQVAGETEAVLSHLAVAVEQIDPPPTLRDRLMAQVAETPQRQPMALQGLAESPRPHPIEPSPAEPTTPMRRDDRPDRTGPADNRPGRGSRWSRRGRQLVSGALALVAVLAIGGLAVRNSQLEQERDVRIAQLEQQRDAQLAQSRSLENLLDQFDRPEVKHALLSREDGSTIAAVVVENGRQQVFPIGIPANAVDRDTYVLWGIAAGANPAPLGTFDVTGNDQGLLTVGSTTDSRYVAYAVSLEPGRTAPAAPSAVVAKGLVAT
jgi:Anti-sigma-K factor rskA